MYIQDPFDIAPHATRHTPVAWGVLLAGAAVAAFAALHFARAWESTAGADEELGAARQALRAQALKASALASEQARAPTDAVRARLELQRILNLSWSGLFDVLEAATKAVDRRVTISSLAPVKLRPAGAEVGVTALAATPDAMLQYLKALQEDRRVQQVQLVSQQLTTFGSAQVLRFQVAILLDRAGAGEAPRPVAVSTEHLEARK